MKLGLIGNGSMGKLVQSLAEEKGNKIAVVVDESDADLSAEELAGKLNGCEAAIDFTTAEAVRRNVDACMKAGVPLVEGTTGWTDQRSDIENLVRNAGGAFVFGANFSIGVNVFYRVADFASE